MMRKYLVSRGSQATTIQVHIELKPSKADDIYDVMSTSKFTTVAAPLTSDPTQETYATTKEANDYVARDRDICAHFQEAAPGWCEDEALRNQRAPTA